MQRNTVSVYRLKKLGVPAQSFDTLYGEIMRVIHLIESEGFSEQPGNM